MTSLRECAWCHVRQFIKARRLCVTCYRLAAKRGELDRWPLGRGVVTGHLLDDDTTHPPGPAGPRPGGPPPPNPSPPPGKALGPTQPDPPLPPPPPPGPPTPGTTYPYPDPPGGPDPNPSPFPPPENVHEGTARTCARCSRRQYHIAGRGLCGACYQHVRVHGELDRYPRLRGAA